MSTIQLLLCAAAFVACASFLAGVDRAMDEQDRREMQAYCESSGHSETLCR